MCSSHSSFSNFRNIEVSKFIFIVFGTENIGAFQVPMKDINFMKGFQPSCHLYESLPNLSFSKMRMIFMMLINFLLDVASISKFHNYAETFCSIIKKCFFIIDNIRMRNRSKYSNLIQRIIPLTFLHLPNFNLPYKFHTFFIAYYF